MLVTSVFFFPNDVYKSLLYQGCSPFTPEIHILTHQQQTAFENIAGQEEIARNEQFLLFPQCFLLNQKIVSRFVNIFNIVFLFAAILGVPKIGM